MTPPSPSSTRPYTRATASAIAAGKRRAEYDSDDEHEADNYFRSQHDNHSQNTSRGENRRNHDDSITDSTDSTRENAEPEDVDMVPVRLTMDESDGGILEQPATSSTSNDHDGSAGAANAQSDSTMITACGGGCSKGYDLRSNHFGRGKENIPPLDEGDWRLGHERSHDIDENGRLLSTPGAGPSGSQSRNAPEEPVQSNEQQDDEATVSVDDNPLRHHLRRSRTMIELPTPRESSSPQATTPTISVSSADPPALSTRARSTRRSMRTTRRGTDEQTLEDTDREDEADTPEASSSTGQVQDVLGSGSSSNTASSSRKRRCIRSSTSLQVPISTSSAANRPSLSRSRPTLSSSPSVSSFQIPTLRSATSNNTNTNTSASSSRRVTRTASSPNITRSATFSVSSNSTSTAMYSMSCAANKRRLSNGPNNQASSFGMGLAELAKASGSAGNGSNRAEKGRKREMSVSSVRSEASISAISTTSYASYSVTSSSAPSTGQGAVFDPDSFQAPTSSTQSTRPSMSAKSTDVRKDAMQPPVNRRLFNRPDSARSEPAAQSLNAIDIPAAASARSERFTLARTDTSASTASSSGLLSSSPTSEMSGGFLFPSTPVDEVMSSPMRSLSRLHSDDLNLLGDLALTPKRARRGHTSAAQVQTPDLTRSPSTSARSDMDAVLDTPPSLVSSTFLTPKASAEHSMFGIEIENIEDEVATPNARRVYADGYKALKAALKCSSSGNDGLGADRPDGAHTIIGREEEKALIQQYLTSGNCDVADDETREGGRKGLYISGPPGTGKTATVSALIAGCASDSKIAFVNCMGLVGKKEEIWSRIADAWGFLSDRQTKEKPERLTERGLSNAPAGSKFILVLDEVDALLPSKACSTSNQILRALFTLPHHHGGLDLKLIAIANSLDLTVRKSVASVLGSHAPFNLTFKAYGAKEMTDIIKRRVQDCNEALKINCPDVLPAYVDDKAIELVGRKVEANNGDLRMCLGVLVEAVNAAETDWRKKATSAGTGARIAPFKISLSHVLKALSSYNKLKANAAATSGTSGVTSGSSSLANKVQSLNVQVRMILLAWLISKQRLNLGLRPAHIQMASASYTSNSSTTSTDTVSTEALYPTYTYVLSSASSPFPPASQPDFMDLLMQAEVLGLLSVEGGDGLTPSKSKARRGRAKERVVELLVKEEDLKTALGIRKDAESETAIAMDSEIRAIWNREEKRWHNSVAGRQRALDSARRHSENGTAGFNEDE